MSVKIKNPRITNRNICQIAFMRSFLSENDRLPNTLELANNFCWKSPNAAQDIFKKFVQLGILERSGVASYRFYRGER